MSEAQDSTTTTTVDSPQSTPPTQPSQQPTPPSAPPAPPANNGPGPAAQMLDAINALPERIVNGLREALQTPQPSQPSSGSKTQDSASKSSADKDSPSDESTKDNKPAAKSEPGNVAGHSRRERFVKFWGAST